MGLMGYVRSGLRQEWPRVRRDPGHLPGRLHAQSRLRDPRWSPVTVLIFFGLIGVVFWLSSLSGKKDYAPGAAAEGDGRIEGGQAA